MPHPLDDKSLKLPGTCPQKMALWKAHVNLKKKGRRRDTTCVLVRGVIFNNTRPPL